MQTNSPLYRCNIEDSSREPVLPQTREKAGRKRGRQAQTRQCEKKNLKTGELRELHVSTL